VNGDVGSRRMMKLLGAVLVVICGYLGMAGNPLFFLGSSIGLLLFLQGMEKSIAAVVVECIRKNKSPQELEADRKREIGLVEGPDEASPDASNRRVDTYK
jgi:hypothetical protein